MKYQKVKIEYALDSPNFRRVSEGYILSTKRQDIPSSLNNQNYIGDKTVKDLCKEAREKGYRSYGIWDTGNPTILSTVLIPLPQDLSDQSSIDDICYVHAPFMLFIDSENEFNKWYDNDPFIKSNKYKILMNMYHIHTEETLPTKEAK